MSSAKAMPTQLQENAHHGDACTGQRRPRTGGGRTKAGVTKVLDPATDSPLVRRPTDPLASAGAAVAWVILANKPLYPITIWWLVGGGFEASLATLIAAPLYAAAPFLVRRAPLAARVATPAIGLADTLLATKIFGPGSGTELFLFACGLLVALSFRPHEVWWARGLVGLIFVAFAAIRLGGGAALYALPPDQLGRLLDLNIFSAASPFAFIGLRFAAVNRE
jgi:hypothetical protein